MKPAHLSSFNHIDKRFSTVAKIAVFEATQLKISSSFQCAFSKSN